MTTADDLKLTIELVPASSFCNNLRSILKKSDWDYLRKKSYAAAKYRCEICNGVGPKHPVECHEKWEYDDETHVQKLAGLYSLCPKCHQVKHIGLASIMGKLDLATAHFMKINGLSRGLADQYISDAFQLHEERSKYSWELDISWLKDS